MRQIFLVVIILHAFAIDVYANLDCEYFTEHPPVMIITDPTTENLFEYTCQNTTFSSCKLDPFEDLYGDNGSTKCVMYDEYSSGFEELYADNWGGDTYVNNLQNFPQYVTGTCGSLKRCGPRYAVYVPSIYNNVASCPSSVQGYPLVYAAIVNRVFEKDGDEDYDTDKGCVYHIDDLDICYSISDCEDRDNDGSPTFNECCSSATYDCNDLDASVYPGALEVCDGKDNNCDGQIDEDNNTDFDMDGHYTPDSCRAPHDDCDDYDSSVYPGRSEECGDGVDNNCNDLIDELCPQPEPSSCEEDAVGDPVDPFSGMYTYSENDIGYPYPSLVHIERKYNSGNPDMGHFGKGTNAEYDHFLLDNADIANTLTYTTPRRGTYDLSLNGSGSYTNTEYPLLRNAEAYLNSDGTRNLVFMDGSTYYFDTYGALVKTEDPNGNWLAIARGTGGIINGLSDSFGRSLDITPLVINGVSVIGSVKDALQNEVVYEYDAEPKLTTVTYPGNGRTVYTYESGIINSVTRYDDHTDPNDPGTTEVVHMYDPSSGRVIRQTYPDGGILEIAYTLDGNGILTETTVTDPRTNSTTYKYNEYGYKTEIVDAYNRSKFYERSPMTNELLSVTDPLVRTTQYTYENGIINSVTDSAGNTSLYLYEDPSVSKPTRIIGPIGNVTTMAYDDNGNLTQLWLPGNANPLITTYNQFGLVNTVTNALGETFSYEYDGHGMIEKITDPMGNMTSSEYDAIGRIINSTDLNGRTTSYAYLNGGRVVEITDPSRGKITMGYSAKGNLVSVTNAKGHTVSYSYNNKSKVGTMTDQVSKSESYDYDLNDNLISVTDRKGQISTVPAGGYDQMDRLTRMDYHDGSYTTFSYDEVGRIVNTVDSLSGQIDYTYTDPSLGDKVPDRVKRVATPQGDIDYTYDELGRRESMTVGGQPAVNYTYTQAGLLNSISTTNPVTSAAMEFGFAYDATGRRTGITYPNGMTTAYGYDSAGRVESKVHKDASGAVLESLAYTYDANGNRTSVDRLGVDPIVPGVTNSTFSEANRMLTFNSAALVHDDNGNLTQKGDMVFTWDTRDRLGAVSNSPGGDASFEYDALDRRVEKTVAGATTKYLYDGLDVVKEMDGAGNMKAYYIRTLNIDEPLARIEPDGTVHYYLADALGSVIAMVDESGNVTARYNYSPFGQTEIMLDTDGSGAANPFRYAGREHDETGLYYYRARYYSPEMRRFISEDPIGFAGGEVNFYAYVGNDPINWVDPLGLDRYNICKNALTRTFPISWACKKIVDDVVCAGVRNAACCLKEELECKTNLDPDCDELSQKYLECEKNFDICLANTQTE